MKIVWVIRPAEGGILQHLQQLSLGIPEFEIVVVGPPALEEWAGPRRFIPLDLVDGLKIREDLGTIRRLRRVFKQEKAQVIHAHGLKAALVTAAALTPLGHPHFLFTAHNSLPQSRSAFGSWGYRVVQRWMFARMDKIISVSDAVRSQIVRYVPERKVLTIYNGISTSRFGEFSWELARDPLGLAHEDQVVGTVARLIPSKGIHTLLEAFSLISKIVPKLKLVVVGDGPERVKLEKYGQALGLENRVHFLGWRDDVPQLMAGWDVFALPSTSEGFNLSVLEAMASRLPVIVADLPSLREAVVPNRGGLVVLPGNAAELAAALLHLLKDPEKAKAMGTFNRDRVNSLFGEERMINCTRALYEGLSLGTRT